MDQFSPIPETQLPEILSARILEYISEHQMKAGDRLPNELEMAASFRVSRGTVRAAIGLLKSRNIVVRKRGLGTFIADSPGLVEDPFGLSFLYDEKEIMRRLTETRLVIEPGIAGLAARRATEAQLGGLEEDYRELCRCIREGRDHIPADMAFHLDLARVSGNPMLLQILRECLKSMPLFGKNEQIPVESTFEALIPAHGAILDAVRAHDPAAAETAMRAHQGITMRLLEMPEN